MVGKVYSILIASVLLVLLLPSSAHAVVQSLNGQTGQHQTFSNDTNVRITSSANTHILQWLGVLPVSRGGTGASSSFTDGSVPFISGGVFSEDNDNLYWDNGNKRLGIGTNTPSRTIDVNGDSIFRRSFTLEGGNDLEISDPSGDSEPGNLSFQRGGQEIFRITMNSLNKVFYFDTAYDNEYFTVMALDGENGNAAIGGMGGPESNAGQEGTLQVADRQGQSTLYIGASSLSTPTDGTGCIALRDTDGEGYTYITANDGVLTASATKPSICQ